jgi:Skp family chaperone for outer membrane proteins
MKSFRFLLSSLLVAALGVSLSAQPKALGAVKLVDVSRIAYVNSVQFGDENTGIKALVRVIKSLELEFASTQSELSLLNEKLRTISGEINKLRADPVTNAKALEEKQTTGLKMQQELQVKQQQAQAAVNQRQQQTQAPVTSDITKELRAFAKERDVSMLFDVSKLGDALLDAKTEMDLTADFVAYYNAKHP